MDAAAEAARPAAVPEAARPDVDARSRVEAAIVAEEAAARPAQRARDAIARAAEAAAAAGGASAPEAQRRPKESQSKRRRKEEPPLFDDELDRATLEEHGGPGVGNLAALARAAQAACRDGASSAWDSVAAGGHKADCRAKVVDWLTRTFDQHGLRDEWLAAALCLFDRLLMVCRASSPVWQVGSLAPALAMALSALKLAGAETELDQGMRDVIMTIARNRKPQLWKEVVNSELRAMRALGYHICVPTPLDLCSRLVPEVATELRARGLAAWPGLEVYRVPPPPRPAGGRAEGSAMLLPSGPRFGIFAAYLCEVALAHAPEEIYRATPMSLILALAALRVALEAFEAPPGFAEVGDHGSAALRGAEALLAEGEAAQLHLLTDAVRGLWASVPPSSPVARKWRGRCLRHGWALPPAPAATATTPEPKARGRAAATVPETPEDAKAPEPRAARSADAKASGAAAAPGCAAEVPVEAPCQAPGPAEEAPGPAAEVAAPGSRNQAPPEPPQEALVPAGADKYLDCDHDSCGGSTRDGDSCGGVSLSSSSSPPGRVDFPTPLAERSADAARLDGSAPRQDIGATLQVVKTETPEFSDAQIYAKWQRVLALAYDEPSSHWADLWQILVAEGWRRELGPKGAGKQEYFLPPGVDRTIGKARVDYFDSKRLVVRHLYAMDDAALGAAATRAPPPAASSALVAVAAPVEAARARRQPGAAIAPFRSDMQREPVRTRTRSRTTAAVAEALAVAAPAAAAAARPRKRPLPSEGSGASDAVDDEVMRGLMEVVDCDVVIDCDEPTPAPDRLALPLPAPARHQTTSAVGSQPSSSSSTRRASGDARAGRRDGARLIAAAEDPATRSRTAAEAYESLALGLGRGTAAATRAFPRRVRCKRRADSDDDDDEAWTAKRPWQAGAAALQDYTRAAGGRLRRRPASAIHGE